MRYCPNHSRYCFNSACASSTACLGLMEENKDVFVSSAMATWQLCPKCSGQGTVSKPPYLAGDVNSWSDSQTQHGCNVCNGKKIISVINGLPPI